MRIKISKKEVQGEFVARVEELSGENIAACYQCGKCSAGCPIVEEMDALPSQIIRLVQLGLEKEALDSKTIWLCASCVTCFSRCPKGVDLSRVMEALRQILLRTGVDIVSPSKLAPSLLAAVPQQGIVSNLRKFSS